MKIIYKLPKWCAVVLLGIIIYIVYCEIKVAKATNIFEIIKYGYITENIKFTVLGMDSYIFFMILGVALSSIVGVLRRQLIDTKLKKTFLVLILFIIPAFVGVKLAFGIEQVAKYASWEHFSFGGFSLYGAVFALMICTPIISKILKLDAMKLFDYYIALGLILVVCVKLGCFSIGCCASRICNIADLEMMLPIQLFEAFWVLILLQAVFYIEERRLVGKCSNWQMGAVFFMTVILYGVYRFNIEFIRATHELWYGFTINQVFAVISIIISIIVLRKKALVSFKRIPHKI